ncbi:MAG: DUF6033 family protein [Lachnospiraceae bacterium]
MSKVNGYSVYQSNYYNNTIQSKKEQDKTQKSDSSPKAADTGKTKQNTVQLSDKAKSLLQELKKQYSNMDFFVADYDTEEEAASYLSRGTKEFSVLIDPEELERMAEDEEVKKQNLALLDEAVGKLSDMKEQLKETENGDQVIQLGVTIGKDGEISYFAELEKVSERQKDFIEKIRAEKKEAAKEAAEEAQETKEDEASKAATQGRDNYRFEKSRRTTVYAGSVEELLEKIAGIDWDTIKEETTTNIPGGHFDLSI